MSDEPDHDSAWQRGDSAWQRGGCLVFAAVLAALGLLTLAVLAYIAYVFNSIGSHK